MGLLLPDIPGLTGGDAVRFSQICGRCQIPLLRQGDLAAAADLVNDGIPTSQARVDPWG